MFKNTAYLETMGDKSVFDHPYVLLFLAAMALFMLYYVIYYYFLANKPQQGYTYYGHDILKQSPLFESTTDNIDQCIDQCKDKANCHGITYDIDNLTCFGQENGRLRSDGDEFYAWVKPLPEKLEYSEVHKPPRNLIGKLESDMPLMIGAGDIPSAIIPDQYSFTFWITVDDWYADMGFWKHVMHRGAEITHKIRYNSWDKLVDELDVQGPGIWLTPYQNNMRISLTVLKKLPEDDIAKHPLVPEFGAPPSTNLSKVEKREVREVMYKDINNFPTGKPTLVTVVFDRGITNIYINDKFSDSFALVGRPMITGGNMYFNYPISYKGMIEEFNFYSHSMDLEEIKNVYKIGNESRLRTALF